MKITVNICSQETLTADKMNISHEFEIMLSLLFGSNNHHGDVDIVGNHEWKNKILKIVGAIEKSIHENLNYTDQYHKQELDRTLKQLKAKLKTSNILNKTNHESILCLTKIIFIILGRFPYHYDNKSTSNRHLWKLDQFRKIGYTQDFKQKAELIIYLSEYSDFNVGLPAKRELQKKLYMELKNNHFEFVQWFKDNYTKNYMKIF